MGEITKYTQRSKEKQGLTLKTTQFYEDKKKQMPEKPTEASKRREKFRNVSVKQTMYFRQS